MTQKTLWHLITEFYPELVDLDFDPIRGSIELRNDGDGFGDYIAKWNYHKPIPQSLTLGKPNA